jgi:hypothetical protein
VHVHVLTACHPTSCGDVLVALADAGWPVQCDLISLSKPIHSPLRELLFSMCLCDLCGLRRLFEVGKTLHDSIDSLSLDDERRQVSDLICRFIYTVSPYD